MGLFERKNENNELKTIYTKKADSLLYTPKGESPNIAELIDDSKVGELIAKINNSNIPEDVKEFLKKAASRFYVFNYSKIAEYYCHQSKEVQELMEDSALVIIDINDAIKKGLCEFSEKLDKLLEKSNKIMEEEDC